MGFRPPLCTYRLNWAKRTSWGWWDEWSDTALQPHDSNPGGLRPSSLLLGLWWNNNNCQFELRIHRIIRRGGGGECDTLSHSSEVWMDWISIRVYCETLHEKTFFQQSLGNMRLASELNEIKWMGLLATCRPPEDREMNEMTLSRHRI